MSKKECMNHWDGKCVGTVGYRHPLSSPANSLPRCWFHWDADSEGEEES